MEVISNKISWRNKFLARLDDMSTDGFTVTEAAQELGGTYSQVASFASRYGISFSKRKSRLAKKELIKEINKNMNSKVKWNTFNLDAINFLYRS